MNNSSIKKLQTQEMNQCCVRLHDSVLEGKVLYRPIIIFFIIDAVMCPQHRSAKMKVGYVRLHLYLHYGSIIDLILFFCKIFSECLMLVCCFFLICPDRNGKFSGAVFSLLAHSKNFITASLIHHHQDVFSLFAALADFL